MLYTDIYGRDRLIRPCKYDQVLILVAADVNIRPGNLFSWADDDFPVTQGFVYGFPEDRTWITTRYPELEEGIHVIFERYSAQYVESDFFYNTKTEMPTSCGIFRVCVDDIFTIVDDQEEAA